MVSCGDLGVRLMMGPAAKRRTAGGEVRAREARLRIAADRVSLLVQGDPDEVTVPYRFDGSRHQAEQWAGDGAASFAQVRGEALWSSVLAGGLGLALQEAASDAADVGEALTIRVMPDGDAPLAASEAPWELLFDQGAFVALSRGWSVVRGTPSDLLPRMLPADGPLRILAVSLLYLDGSPDFWRLAFESAPQEMDSIDQLAGRRSDRATSTRVLDPDRDDFLTLLATADADVLHIVATGSDGMLVVRDPAAGSDLWDSGHAQMVVAARDVVPPPPMDHRLSGVAIAEALAANPGVAMAVFNGCSTDGIASQITDLTGITTLGHAGAVADPYAAALPTELYGPIVSGQTVDLAIADARRGLEQRFPGQAAWSSTRLFTGWPPPRFGPEQTSWNDPIGYSTSSVSSEPRPRGADDLVRLMHATNLARLKGLPEQGWGPIAEQVQRAAAGAG